MNAEQELMWNILTNDPKHYCHYWAEQLTSCPKNKMNALADDCLKTIIQLFDVETCCRIVATWLREYNLDLNPNKINSFEDFHVRCGPYVTNLNNKIQSY